MVSKPLESRFRFVALIALALALLPGLASAQAIIKVNDNVNFRLGFQLQAWGDWLQDPTTMGYAQNLYIRRVRLIVAGQLAPDVTFFFETDNPNLGKAPKALASGFLVQDAFLEWKIANEFRLDGGLFIPPFSRDALKSTSSYVTLDIAPVTTLANGVTQSSGTRDTGFGAKGFFLKDHLEYRAYVFQGFREAASRNPFRYTGRIQYNVFDTETGYVYPSMNLGKRKILAFGAGSDNQQDYHAYSGDVAFDIPVAMGDAISGSGAWYHFDGEGRFPTLFRQNDYLADLGYYISAAKFEPFIQFQTQRYSDPVHYSLNQDRYQAGLTYFISGHNMKITGAFTRLAPATKGVPNTNEFTFQIQAFYF